MPRYICTDTCQWPGTRLHEQGQPLEVAIGVEPPAHCFKLIGPTAAEEAAAKVVVPEVPVVPVVEVAPVVLNPEVAPVVVEPNVFDQ